MRILSFGKYLTQLTQYPSLFPINCYFVREDDGLTLIDTGYFNNAKSILGAADAQKMPIKRIVFTHAHGDHVGSLDDLHAALPDAEVMISTRDARFLAGDRTLDPNEPQTPLKGDYRTCTTRPTRLLEEGDRIGSLEVVASPGHTPGHVAFLDVRDRSLIAGDSFQTQGGIAVTGELRLLFPVLVFATWNRPVALASAKKLRALSPSRLAVGHGPVLENPLAAMDNAINEADQHLAKMKTYATN